MHPNVIKSNPHDRGTAGVVHNVERRAYAQQKAEAERWRDKEAPPPWETTPPAPPVTQEQRDEATAIAQVQNKKKRTTSKRATPKRAAKRLAATRAMPVRRKVTAGRKATAARRAKRPHAKASVRWRR